MLLIACYISLAENNFRCSFVVPKVILTVKLTFPVSFRPSCQKATFCSKLRMLTCYDTPFSDNNSSINLSTPVDTASQASQFWPTLLFACPIVAQRCSKAVWSSTGTLINGSIWNYLHRSACADLSEVINFPIYIYTVCAVTGLACEYPTSHEVLWSLKRWRFCRRAKIWFPDCAKMIDRSPRTNRVYNRSRLDFGALVIFWWSSCCGFNRGVV